MAASWCSPAAMWDDTAESLLEILRFFFNQHGERMVTFYRNVKAARRYANTLACACMMLTFTLLHYTQQHIRLQKNPKTIHARGLLRF